MRSQGKLRPMHRSLKSPIVRHVAIAAAGLCALIAARPAPAQPVLHDVAALKAQVEAFASGAPARIDPRLVVPRCPAPAFSWARADVVRADCAGPVWTPYVPVDQPQGIAAPRARPAIRRGDRVMVETAGPGWSVAIEVEAERDADGDRVAVKGPAGRRFSARLVDGGKLILAR